MQAAVHGEQVLYLYGVVPAGQRLPASGAIALEAIAFSRLVALVEPVSASAFSAGTLEEKLQCVDWVAPLARKHCAVLEDVMRHGPVVPARLCTLFSGTPALTSLLAQNEQRWHETLSWLEGRQEWGCKVFCHEGGLRAALGASDATAEALEAAAATASPGQAYVLGKKRERRLVEVACSRIDEVVEEVFDALDALVVESRARPLRSEAATGRSDVMVLNTSLLVDVAVYPSLRDTIAELASRLGAEGFACELTGPWPPYSFCDDDGARDASSNEDAFEQGA